MTNQPDFPTIAQTIRIRRFIDPYARYVGDLNEEYCLKIYIHIYKKKIEIIFLFVIFKIVKDINFMYLLILNRYLSSKNFMFIIIS